MLCLHQRLLDLGELGIRSSTFFSLVSQRDTGSFIKGLSPRRDAIPSYLTYFPLASHLALLTAHANFDACS